MPRYRFKNSEALALGGSLLAGGLMGIGATLSNLPLQAVGSALLMASGILFLLARLKRK